MSLEQSSSHSLLRLPVNDVADCVLLLNKSNHGNQASYLLGGVSLRKLAGSLSIHGHNLADNRWYSACSAGPSLVTLECSSRRHIKYSSELLSEIVDNEVRQTVKAKLRKSNIGCVLILKSNRLPMRLQCEHMFDFGSIKDTQNLEQQELQRTTVDLGFTLFVHAFFDQVKCLYQPRTHAGAEFVLLGDIYMILESLGTRFCFSLSCAGYTVELSDIPKTFIPLTVSPSWKSIPGFVESHLNQESGSPVVLICGGKNVGKSTFARYMLNKLLNTQKVLYFLETDVGQSEFTPPGVISLNKVEKPIFGPPFFHMSKPERAFFFGDTSPKDRPTSYVQLIYTLHQYYTEHCSEVPLIVNTCGWVKGMGVRILLDIIRIVQPSHLIQINCAQPTRNLPELTEDFLLSEDGWSYPLDYKSSWTCPPHIYQMDAYKSSEETTNGSTLQASELRSLSLLSYFGSTQCPSSIMAVQEYILKHCPVYSRALCGLDIHCICDKVSPGEVLNSVIGSVVGLVRVETNQTGSSDAPNEYSVAADNVQFGEYVGLGIVRNIDMSKRMLYIVTPEPLEVLNAVNVLVKGRLEILDSLYKKQAREDLPYVTSEFSYHHRGSGQKRVRYNLLRQKPPNSPKQKKQKTSSSS